MDRAVENVVYIKRRDLRPNPFNPKHAIHDDVDAALRDGIEKNGFIGTLVVVSDYREAGAFIVLDGNTRYTYFQDDDDVPCCIYDGGIDCDEQLKRLTVEYVAVAKKTNLSEVGKIIASLKEASTVTALFKNAAISFDEIRRDFEAEHKEKFSKIIVLQFKDAGAHARYMEIVENTRKKISQSSDILGKLEEAANKTPVDILARWLADMLLSEYGVQP